MCVWIRVPRDSTIFINWILININVTPYNISFSYFKNNTEKTWFLQVIAEVLHENEVNIIKSELIWL